MGSVHELIEQREELDRRLSAAHVEFPATKTIAASQPPTYDGLYKATLKDGQVQLIEFSRGKWAHDGKKIVGWRGRHIRLSRTQYELLLHAVHEGRLAADKADARLAALWLARFHAVHAEGPISPKHELQARCNACGWYEIARRLGVSFDSTPGESGELPMASSADIQAQERSWSRLPASDRVRITQLADGFADGAGLRLEFD
ncbi:hypothetical protein R70006_06288 [Paraburkholderia domus]|uniref:hypothetical protein n=1 Tax=Paraburkholderia domus TaxID=2793075 RepID=UPI0019129092|nr:hypothetical protein [Paraburkholderia domus]MBK5052918.1 hypothetical protein [Burkholderia sp. R-70006]CAE6822857.1 hypothetical protein R70006_06288 [Paraburkholderia domus]